MRTSEHAPDTQRQLYWFRSSVIRRGGVWVARPAPSGELERGAQVYPVGAGADGSVCQRPNSFPWGSVQVANQPMPGTEPGSLASPPSSFTRAARWRPRSGGKVRRA